MNMKERRKGHRFNGHHFRGRGVSGKRFAIVLVFALAIAVLLASGSPANVAANTGVPALVEVVEPPVSTATYSGIDYGKKARSNDDREMTTTWRVVEETGNCCETYITIAPNGRLLDFGGRFIYYSDDRGQNWLRVKPLTPLVNGEGAIVVAPDGDVLGVEWDPYSGDHLQFYKLEADTQQWFYTEMPLHQPFYDREWIAVIPGPVTINGETHDYVSFVKGGIPKEVWYYSTDGLNYTEVTSKDLDRLLTGMSVVGPLPTSQDSMLDWVQPNTRSGITALGNGKALASPDFFGGWSLLDNETFTWSNFQFSEGVNPSGRFQVDSLGRIHNVVPSSEGMAYNYRISADGGETWKETTVQLPENYEIEAWDFRANLDAGVAAVSIRAHNVVVGTDQDLVYKFDITGVGARLQRLYNVGLGDVDAVGGFGNPIRFDFASVAIFPDGRIAVSFLDSTTTLHSPTTGNEGAAPAMAIEGETTLGKKVKPSSETAPVLGEPYVNYSFEAGAEGWTAEAPWLRFVPGVNNGEDDSNMFSFGIEGPQYTDNLNASLISPVIHTEAGRTVLEFWTKADIEDGFDLLRMEWSANGSEWSQFGQFTGQNDGYPSWEKLTYAFDSPGGDVQVRFRFRSDLLCSGATLAPLFGCDRLYNGFKIDEVVVGKQAN